MARHARIQPESADGSSFATSTAVFDELFTTNVLLGVIAGVQVAFLLGAAIALWYVRSAVKTMQSTVSALEREHVRPLRTQAEQILADVSRISARVQAQAARVDSSVSSTLDVAERQVQRVRAAVDAVARETGAVASGVRAAVSAVSRRTRHHDAEPTSTRPFPSVDSHEEDLHASFR
jgi:uncharacterized protein YoxC